MSKTGWQNHQHIWLLYCKYVFGTVQYTFGHMIRSIVLQLNRNMLMSHLNAVRSIGAGQHRIKKRAGLVTGPLNRRTKNKIRKLDKLEHPLSPQGTYGTDTEWQQHQGTSHDR